MASCCMPGRSSMALFTRTVKLDPGAHRARCAWAMAIHHAAGINWQRNSGYRPSRINIMARGLSTPDPSLSPTHLSIRRVCATTTHYTHHQVSLSLMVSRNTTLAHSLGLRIRPACEAGLSACIRRERVSHQIRKKKKKDSIIITEQDSLQHKPTSCLRKTIKQQKIIKCRRNVCRTGKSLVIFWTF